MLSPAGQVHLHPLSPPLLKTHKNANDIPEPALIYSVVNYLHILVLYYLQHITFSISQNRWIQPLSPHTEVGHPAVGQVQCFVTQMKCSVVYGDFRRLSRNFIPLPSYLSKSFWSITSVPAVSDGVHSFGICSTCTVWAYISYCPCIVFTCLSSISLWVLAMRTHPNTSSCCLCLALCLAWSCCSYSYLVSCGNSSRIHYL